MEEDSDSEQSQDEQHAKVVARTFKTKSKKSSAKNLQAGDVTDTDSDYDGLVLQENTCKAS